MTAIGDVLHTDCMAEVFLRPDHVTRSGVVTPFPIRSMSPVAAARGTVTTFVDSVRRMGPTLSGALGMSPLSEKVRAVSAPMANLRYGLGRIGPRPVLAVPQVPSVGTGQAMNTMRKVWSATPQTRNVLTSWYKAEYARAFGSNWDMIIAKQRQLGMRTFWK